MKRLLLFALLISVYTACDDNNDPGKKPTDPEIIPTAVNYVSSDGQVFEQAEMHEVVIVLDEPAEADGTLEIALSGEAEYGTYFTTEPAVSEGKISLAVAKGDTEVTFSVVLVNNTKLNGNKTASFTLVNATGSVTMGESVTYALTLLDDELLNKLQSTTKNGSGLTQTKNQYEYNEDGLVSKINWESKTAFGTKTGSDVYTYNTEGGITQISKLDGALKTIYVWEDGIIVKSEQVSSNVVMSYNLYEYDEAGRVKHIDTFTNDGLGNFASDFYTEYTYYEDGNVHKITVYSFSQDEDKFVVSATTTYEGYVEGHSPFPLEIFPNHKIQTKLPTYYSRGSQANLLEFNVAYEFSENGNLIKKEITGAAADSGVTTYSYY